MSQDKEFFTTFFIIMGGLAIFAIILVIIASNLTSDVTDYKPEEIVVENIKPVGEVYIAGESEPEAAPEVGADANSTCLACHATGAAGAPKLGDAAAWAPRIAAGMDSLIANATNGLKAMPPKGLCMTCSDAELQSAIEYIVDNSQ